MKSKGMECRRRGEKIVEEGVGTGGKKEWKGGWGRGNEGVEGVEGGRMVKLEGVSKLKRGGFIGEGDWRMEKNRVEVSGLRV